MILRNLSVAALWAFIGTAPAVAENDATKAFRSYIDQRPQSVMSLTCTATGAIIFGFSGAGARDGPTMFTVSLNSDGSLIVNGQQIAASFTHAEGGQILLSVIPFDDFFHALAGHQSGSGRAMFLDPQQSAALDALMNRLPGVIMQDRQRVMIFDVMNRYTVFADLTNDQIQSPRKADCYVTARSDAGAPFIPRDREDPDGEQGTSAVNPQDASENLAVMQTRENELDSYYPCGAHLSLEDKERLNAYANATRSDPCTVVDTREELHDLIGAP